MNEITQYHDDDDDGYGGSLTSGRLIKGQLMRWNETNGWIDRDGLQPAGNPAGHRFLRSSAMLEGQEAVETITEKPLPDINDLERGGAASRNGSPASTESRSRRGSTR